MVETRRCLVRDAAAALHAAGVASASYDAEELVAHVLGVPRSRLPLVDEVTAAQADELRALVERRAAREPLQHLTGVAGFRYVELVVGPGVFVPRPETELLAGWAVEQAAPLTAPVVVDLCTGSGAIARALADEVPHARIHAWRRRCAGLLRTRRALAHDVPYGLLASSKEVRAPVHRGLEDGMEA